MVNLNGHKIQIQQLPSMAGKVLKRLGRDNALEISDDVLIERIRSEQERRTRERRLAQIARAEKARVRREGKGVKLEVSVSQGVDNEAGD